MKAPIAIQELHLYECPNCGHVTDLRTIQTRMAKVLGSMGGKATGPAKSHPLTSEAARKLVAAKRRKARREQREKLKLERRLAAVTPFAKRENTKALAVE